MEDRPTFTIIDVTYECPACHTKIPELELIYQYDHGNGPHEICCVCPTCGTKGYSEDPCDDEEEGQLIYLDTAIS